MTSTQYALIALFFYAISNITIDRYFSHVEPLVSVFIYCGVIALMSAAALTVKYKNGSTIVLPTGYLWLTIVLCGVGCFFAEGAFFSAYNVGGRGSLTQITTIVATMPVFATLMKSLIDLKWPSLTQLTGCLLATAAVYLVTNQGGPTKTDIGLVFGYGQSTDGELLPQTKARCDVAVSAYEKGTVGKLAVTCYVDSNGIRMGKKMREYLIARGVPEEKILLDECGMNTAGEIDTLLRHVSPSDTIVGFSSYYHLPRIWFLFASRGWNVSLNGTVKATNPSDLLWEPLKILNALCRPKSWSKVTHK
ncbi:MAG: YdcF family protein [Candidatus Vogelbacteria bacterium]|nr:YdcF family protein [Candidatus Vogelbacteria bacterium]